MSECVVRMEMPQKCFNCDLRYECNAFYAPGKPKPFMKGCMIVCQLPEGHGRLVDADAMAEDVRSLWDYETVDGITASTVLKQTLTDIGNCPTIVPAAAERRTHERTDKA